VGRCCEGVQWGELRSLEEWLQVSRLMRSWHDSRRLPVLDRERGSYKVFDRPGAWIRKACGVWCPDWSSGIATLPPGCLYPLALGMEQATLRPQPNIASEIASVPRAELFRSGGNLTVRGSWVAREWACRRGVPMSPRVSPASQCGGLNCG
jgi:hypothetical protein